MNENSQPRSTVEAASAVWVYDINARQLVRVMAQHFPYGITSGKLKGQFEKNTGLKKQTYYNALELAKAKQWIVGAGGKKGQQYCLNPNGCWREALVENFKSATEQAGSISNQCAGPITDQSWTDSHLALISEAIQDVGENKH
jgi:hypothetical protein